MERQRRRPLLEMATPASRQALRVSLCMAHHPCGTTTLAPSRPSQASRLPPNISTILTRWRVSLRPPTANVHRSAGEEGYTRIAMLLLFSVPSAIHHPITAVLFLLPTLPRRFFLLSLPFPTSPTSLAAGKGLETITSLDVEGMLERQAVPTRVIPRRARSRR